METDKDIFSDLESLGFKDMGNITLYDKKEEEIEEGKAIEKEEINEEAYLYDRSVICPVCNSKFTARTVKTNAPMIKEKDKDLFIRYRTVNPYFYDVWLCNICGYTSMKADFNKIRKIEIERVQKGISSKWHGREYPKVYDVNIAIERYKVSLLNYTIMESKASKKAINCLKIAWMYRLIEDTKSEQLFIEQAVVGLRDAYFNEDFPIYGMDKFTTIYLIGELQRRLGNYDEALKQFSDVITSQVAGRRIKDLAWDQKELIKETLQEDKNNLDEEDIINDDLVKEIEDPKKKKGFFKRFFG